MNDLLLTVDSGNCAILELLYLSAAFDTIDHHILLNSLKQEIGIHGAALAWFLLYLTNRSFSVEIGACSSTIILITYGVPQGSILGTILFSLYLLPLHSIFEQHEVFYHCYVDDTKLYLPLKSRKVVDSSFRLSKGLKRLDRLTFPPAT